MFLIVHLYIPGGKQKRQYHIGVKQKMQYHIGGKQKMQYHILRIDFKKDPAHFLHNGQVVAPID
jgi:hypothetical protein